MGARVTYPSVEAMLEPTELAGLLGRPVNSVALASMTTVGSSSTESDFRGVFVDGEATPAAVLKIVRWSRDWHAIATEDTRGREVAIWECGVLDRLSAAMGHAVRGAARFADGAALLMDHLTRHFLPDEVRVGPERARGVLRAMAAMHATFWEDPPIGDLGTAICPLERLLTRLSGTMLTSLGGVLPDIELVATFPEGWDLLAGVVDPGVARDLRALADDPTPIMTALDGCPITLRTVTCGARTSPGTAAGPSPSTGSRPWHHPPATSCTSCTAAVARCTPTRRWRPTARCWPPSSTPPRRGRGGTTTSTSASPPSSR